MTCTRCQGFLRFERIHWRSSHHLKVCMACGDRTDATILTRRHEMAQHQTFLERAQLWERMQTLVTMQEVSA